MNSSFANHKLKTFFSLERVTVAALLLLGQRALASTIAGSKHDLSTDWEPYSQQVCVFCHTPHGATPGVTPLWNRALSNQTYTPYTSSSLDALRIRVRTSAPPMR